MIAYKFLPSGFLPDLLGRGSIKIGTAEEYRVPDELDDGRSDEHEMTARYSPGRVQVRIGDVPTLKAQFSPDGSRDDIYMAFEDGTILASRDDAYLFCASKVLTRKLVRGMAEKFNSDACVEITDLAAFAIAITNACPQLRVSDKPDLPAGFYGNEVEYIDVDERSGLVQHAWQKRTKFSWQEEFRLLWPGAQPRKPFLIEVPEITNVIRPIDLSPWR